MAQVPEFGLTSDAQALELMNNVSLISDLDPEAKNLEGYLFPDTYEFSPEMTPADLIATMVSRFRAVWKPDWTDRARSLSIHSAPDRNHCFDHRDRSETGRGASARSVSHLQPSAEKTFRSL